MGILLAAEVTARLRQLEKERSELGDHFIQFYKRAKVGSMQNVDLAHELEELRKQQCLVQVSKFALSLVNSMHSTHNLSKVGIHETFGISGQHSVPNMFY